jgi:creatinine amidohydrolase/Fe(II)-dependent formamide hydrolase-like protein
VLVFPLIPLSSGGANEIGGKFSFSGTYAIRTSTLRAIFMDLATELGEQGFRWIFIVHAHGSPNHNFALDQAGDYFHDFYDGHMVNLFGLILPELPGVVQALMTNEQYEEDGMISVHAGMRETSEMLFLQRELVDAAYKSAPPLAARNRKQLVRIAEADDWPGYFGSPRLASAAFGAKYWKQYSSRVIDVAVRILEGFDYRQMKRVKVNPVSERALKHERDIERKQSEWLKTKQQR